MVNSNVFPTPQHEQKSLDNQQEKNEKYNVFEMLWFCITAKYQQWFTAKDIQEVKTHLSEKEIDEFLLEAAKHGGFFDHASDGYQIKFKTTVSFNNIIG